MNIGQFYVGLADFFDMQFFAIFVGIIIFFVSVYIIWLMYRTLSRRNIFTLHERHRITHPKWAHFVYLSKYLFIFPLISFSGFLLFALTLFLHVKPTTLADQQLLFYIAIVSVGVIRVAAYVNEQLAEDIAKLFPLSLLFLLLTHPAVQELGVTWTQTVSFIGIIPTVLKYLLITIILEALLRGGSWLILNWNREDEESKTKA